jgi:hypothetical protein
MNHHGGSSYHPHVLPVVFAKSGRVSRSGVHVQLVDILTMPNRVARQVGV